MVELVTSAGALVRHEERLGSTLQKQGLGCRVVANQLAPLIAERTRDGEVLRFLDITDNGALALLRSAHLRQARGALA